MYPRPIGDVDLEEIVKKKGIKHFLLSFSSYVRDCRVVMVQASKAREFQQYGCEVLGGVDFFTELEAPKLLAVPAVETLIQLPWDPTCAWVACDLYSDEKPFDQCPRQILKQVLKTAKEHGFEVKTGIEFEFLLYKKEALEDLSSDTYKEGFINLFTRKEIIESFGVLDQIVSCLEDLGWCPEKVEKESLPRQFEIVLQYTECLEMADRQFFFKFLAKSIAEKEGYRAIFMPMSAPGPIGNSMHLNFSFWDTTSKANLMPNSSNTAMALSKVGEQCIAGIMQNTDALCAIAAPTVNSYKRINAHDNFLNLVAYSCESKWPAVRSTCTGDRVEYRVADSAVNPYLLPASVISAALHGIEHELELDPNEYFDKVITAQTPKLEEYRSLPDTLESACTMLDKNDVMRKRLGDAFVDGFLQIKKRELNEYKKHITKWEISLVDLY